MAQNNTYRQQTSIGLSNETACPQCGTNPPLNLSYEVEVCEKLSKFYVSQSDAFFGTNQVINSTTYPINKVVWITAGATSTRTCAKIIDVDVDESPTMYIDIQGGPWDSCSECITLDETP